MWSFTVFALVVSLQSNPVTPACKAKPDVPQLGQCTIVSSDSQSRTPALRKQPWNTAQVIGNRCFIPDGSWCWTNPAPVGSECFCAQTQGRVRQ